MSDIELVIKISNYDKEWITNGYCIPEEINTRIAESIAKGTPLPEGHGRLVDADELLTSERPRGIADDVWKESHIYKLLSNAPTIIEADKDKEVNADADSN